MASSPVPMPVPRAAVPGWLKWLPVALVLTAMLFIGGLAAGERAGQSAVAARHVLEVQAVPLAGEIGVVTPEQVLAVAPDAYQLVDVRSREAFALSHATGAMSMPEAEEVDLMASLPADRTLVLYCSCPDEKTSLRAARTLSTVFHRPHLVVLKGGLDAYAAAGGPMTIDEDNLGVKSQGCGCDVNAPAYKLWAGNLAAARERERGSGSGSEQEKESEQ